MATKYPPYVNAYGSISKLFEEIIKAAVPTKFTHDFVQTVLGLKSSSFRATIPLLKRLGFLDQSSVPTQAYKDYREKEKSRIVMAKRVRESFDTLFAANEFAYKLNKEELKSKLQTLTGAAASDEVIPVVVGTFLELCKLSDFENKQIKQAGDSVEESNKKTKEPREDSNPIERLGLSYTINLNLPATTEVEVFNAIFKSLKEHLLGN